MRICSAVVLSHLGPGFEPQRGQKRLFTRQLAACCLLLKGVAPPRTRSRVVKPRQGKPSWVIKIGLLIFSFCGGSPLSCDRVSGVTQAWGGADLRGTTGTAPELQNSRTYSLNALSDDRMACDARMACAVGAFGSKYPLLHVPPKFPTVGSLIVGGGVVASGGWRPHSTSFLLTGLHHSNAVRWNVWNGGVAEPHGRQGFGWAA